jgi:hypothetical protein
MEKVLLLQGPLISTGTSELVSCLFLADREARSTENWNHTFNCDETIRSMVYAFRARGFRIVYSAWDDDAAWFDEHAHLFDQVVLSDQSKLRTETMWNGSMIGNRKEKMYYAALRGLQAVEELFGADALVFRLRSDVAVDPRHVLADMARLVGRPRLVLTEYFNAIKPMKMPDFMQLGQADVLRAIYAHMYHLSSIDNSYHVSSHIDHSITFVQLLRQGALDTIETMSRATFESAVWRGVPRYLAYAVPGFADEFGFNCGCTPSPDLNVDALLASMGWTPKSV